MKIPYITFMKHAELVTRKASDARPILKGVYHAEDGSAVVTDSHRLYLARNIQERKDNSVINPKTGETINGTYPKIERVLPADDPIAVIHLENLPAVYEAVKALQQAGMIPKLGEKKLRKERVIFTLQIKRQEGTSTDEVLLSVNNGIQAGYFVGCAKESPLNAQTPSFTMYFNAEYFVQALALFKDVGYPTVTMNIYGEHRPFTLTGDENLLALILPIKRN